LTTYKGFRVACLDGSVVDEEHFDLHVAKIRGKYPWLS